MLAFTMQRALWAVAFVVVVISVIVLALAISAAMLMAAVKIYNAIAGGHSAKNHVPAPSFGRAFAIVLILFFIGLFSRFCGNILVLSICQVSNASDLAMNISAIPLGIAVYIMNASALLTALLIVTVLPIALIVNLLR